MAAIIRTRTETLFFFKLCALLSLLRTKSVSCLFFVGDACACLFAAMHFAHLTVPHQGRDDVNEQATNQYKHTNTINSMYSDLRSYSKL